MDKNDNWQDVFCGRDEELQLLKDKWVSLSKSKNASPSVVSLVAESGFGKTRLIQEFYSWLVATCDKDQYWASQLNNGDDSLRVHPLNDSCDFTKKMPFLWWGLRFIDPCKRNGFHGNSLSAYRESLKDHIAPLFYAKNASSIGQEAGLKLSLAIADIFLFGLPGAARDVFELKRDQKALKETQNRHLDGPSQDVLVEKILDSFRLMFDSKHLINKTRDITTGIKASDICQVPVIIILDDAQWIDNQARTFFSRLIIEAKQKDWPILFIVTHWEREWYLALEGENGIESFPQMISQDLCSHEMISLGKVKKLSLVLDQRLPGLTDYQKSNILERVDGNPLLLEEVIKHFVKRQRLFCEDDPFQSLNEEGEEYLLKRSFDLEGLIEDRFLDLPEEIKEVLGWSSCQGIRFFEKITTAIITKMELQNYDVQLALSKGVRPYALIQSVGDYEHEFHQRAYYQTASNYLSENQKKKIRSIILEVIEDIIERGEIWSVKSHDFLISYYLDVSASDSYKSKRPWLKLFAKLLLSFPGEFSLAWKMAGRSFNNSRIENKKLFEEMEQMAFNELNALYQFFSLSIMSKDPSVIIKAIRYLQYTPIDEYDFPSSMYFTGYYWDAAKLISGNESMICENEIVKAVEYVRSSMEDIQYYYDVAKEICLLTSDERCEEELKLMINKDDFPFTEEDEIREEIMTWKHEQLEDAFEDALISSSEFIEEQSTSKLIH